MVYFESCRSIASARIDLKDGAPALIQEPRPKSQNLERSYKTALCTPFSEHGFCRYGSRCRFAHGMAELRQRPNPRKYKTVLCRNVVQGRDCPYGSRCDYIHASDISAAATTSPARLPRVPMQQILCPGGNSGALTIDPGRDHMYRSIGTPAPAASPIYSVSRPAEGRGRTHLGAYISLLEQMHPRALGNARKEMNLAAEYERYNGIFAAFGAARSARPAAWSSAEMLYTSFGFPETRPDALLDQLRSQK